MNAEPRLILALAALACAAPALAHAQAWSEIADPETGVAVQFPAPPMTSQSAYPSAGGPVPSTVYALQQPGREYSLAVADFTEHPRDQARAVKGALAQLRAGGEVKLEAAACISGQPGRELSLASKDGGQARVSIYSVGRRIYFLEARLAPAAATEASSDAVRFQQSLRFNGPRLGAGPAVAPSCRGKAREASAVGP